MDIFERLKKDHEKHRELLTAIQKTGSKDGKERRRLFEEFKTETTAHAAAEEETLYATMMRDTEGRHDAQHSVAEHKEVGDMLEELAKTDETSEDWMDKFDKLRKRYLHHIDEEEDDMFPKAKELLSKPKTVELEKEFESRKPEELRRAAEGVDEGDDRG
jgi:hemerythrin superfamily protein